MPATRSLPENPSPTRYVVMRVWHDFLRHRTIDAAASLTFFSTLTTFGTSRDITLEELRVECMFPADDETAAFCKALAEKA